MRFYKKIYDFSNSWKFIKNNCCLSSEDWNFVQGDKKTDDKRNKERKRERRASTLKRGRA